MSDLIVYSMPRTPLTRMIVGLTGWMDAGHVSTGAVAHIREQLSAERFAEINGLEFYVLNFPVATIPITVYSEGEHTVVSSVNPMEFSAIFRPHAEIADGIVRRFTPRSNDLYAVEERGLVLLAGDEPQIRWGAYCETLLSLAEQVGTRSICFLGSVASPIPHTREPRVRGTVSDEALKPELAELDVDFTDYSGPASVVTLLAVEAARRGMAMYSLVVEVPHYPFLSMPTYPKSILRGLALLNRLLDLGLDLTDMTRATEVAELKLNQIQASNREFDRLVRKLEEAYDMEEASTDEQVLRQLIEGIDFDGQES